MKMKLNIRRTILFLCGVLCIGLFIGDWIYAILHWGFTWYGLLINLLEFMLGWFLIEATVCEK